MITATGEGVPLLREDGRTQRTRRTRAAIVEAHISLLAQGDHSPSAQRIAECGGVSVRTLWTHFADMEALFTATADAVLRSQVQAYNPIPVDLPLEVRIDRFCRQRARLMEKLTPFATASEMREPLSPALQRYRARHVKRVAAEVQQLFAAELPEDTAASQELVHALAAASTWGSWSVLRQHLGLGVTRARKAMTRTVTALLLTAGTTVPTHSEEPA